MTMMPTGCPTKPECKVLWGNNVFLVFNNESFYHRQSRISDTNKYNHTTTSVPDLKNQAPDPNIFTKLIGEQNWKK